MPRPTRIPELTDTVREQLNRWIAAQYTPQQVVQRSRIILLAAKGDTDPSIADQLQLNRKSVALWRHRFIEEGVVTLWEIAAGRGRKPTYSAKQIKEIVNATLQTKPKGMTHWSCRSMAEAQGISKATVKRIWQSHNIKPHLVKNFKVSRDAKFLEKLTDVVGLYLSPPEKAIVLCIDEKSQIQALDRTQPGLPWKKGRCGTMTHDYKRNGTATLFAALNVLDGKVIGQCSGRHRHQEFLRFLRRLDWDFPGDQELHLVLDNYGTHKHPNVKAWMKKHPRFVPHFVPTSSSWLNLVERWFGELTAKRVRRGSFSSVQELQNAIAEFLTNWNEKPKPFIWTATVESIIKKIDRARAKVEQIKPGSTLPRRKKKAASL